MFLARTLGGRAEPPMGGDYKAAPRGCGYFTLENFRGIPIRFRGGGAR